MLFWFKKIASKFWFVMHAVDKFAIPCFLEIVSD